MFALGAALRALNPNAPVLDLAAGEFGVEEFLRERAGEIGSAPSEPHIAHDPRLRSFAFRAAQPASSPAIGEFLRRLSAALGPKLLRVKGLVAQAANPARPLAIHGVQHILHPPRLLAAWPDADRSTRIVAIAEGGEGEAIERLWRALTGPIEPDAPDLMALTSSPLAIRRAGLLGD